MRLQFLSGLNSISIYQLVNFQLAHTFVLLHHGTKVTNW